MQDRLSCCSRQNPLYPSWLAKSSQLAQNSQPISTRHPLTQQGADEIPLSAKEVLDIHGPPAG